MTARNDPPPDDVRTGEDDDELLPCGRLLSQVWEDREGRGEDPHADSCPHCREAVRGLDRLESAVLGLREEVPDTSGYDAERLTRRVMDLVRLELRPGRPLPLGLPAEDLWIMEAVAARTLRAAAEAVDGVRAGSCRITAADGPDSGSADGARPDGGRLDGGRADGRGAYGDGRGGGRGGGRAGDRGADRSGREGAGRDGAGGEGAGVRVRLDIHAPADASLPQLAERVRQRVRDAADRELGLVTAAVDIRITDLVDLRGDGQEGRTP
ncbi:Asp23/Gls24 family envelope stress response protein [Streptomyces sp. MS06]|uniref:Asp23/Gls24 family envelope stress response protein n=1 Tax=Streptomyces sp. MS06 TaxID=3385974 RepID=UPI00399FBDF1